MTAGDVEVIRGSLNSKKCFACDGTDDYMQVNAHAVERTTANDTVGTYTAWVMVDNITGTYCILCAGDDNVVEFIELSIESGLVTARCTDATVAQFVTQTNEVVITAKKWHHIGLVQAANAAGPVLYVDGVSIASTNDISTDVNEWYNGCDGLDTFRIGAANKAGDASVTDDFLGLIGPVKYWSRALSADDIYRDYKGLDQPDAVLDASTYLRMNHQWDTLVDAGLGADNATIVNNAYLHGWGSEWSRLIELNYTNAADFMNTYFANDGTATTIIVQGA
jgi:hypothetical protein